MKTFMRLNNGASLSYDPESDEYEVHILSETRPPRSIRIPSDALDALYNEAWGAKSDVNEVE